MKKIGKYKLVLFLAIIAVLVAGCSHSNSSTVKPEASDDATPNPFEANDPNTTILGSISHGFTNPQLDEQGKILPLQYNGGELKINYSVVASGKAKNVGFLVFVNGQPQPYKFNTSEAPYEYMHIFELEKENQDTPFSFVFTPVTGKKGDTLHVSIASVYNPGFTPDMKETTSYGGYQTTLEAGSSLTFTQNADSLDISPIAEQGILSNVRLSTELVTQELLEKHSILETVDMETLDKNVYSDLYVDGDIRQDNFQIKKSGTLRVTFNLFGHPGMRYRSTFYLNHKALASQDGTSFETKLTKGNVGVINVDLDLEKLEDLNTFYVVSVPLNPDDFPDDVVVLMKTPSLLLYK